jgi:Tfp pilus assembly protein PilF
MTYHRQGDESLARDTLTKALSLDRNFAGADDAAKILQSLAVTDNAKNGLRS